MSAFAAHGLKDRLSADALGWIKTASDYEMWHGLAALFAIGLTGRDAYLVGCDYVHRVASEVAATAVVFGYDFCTAWWRVPGARGLRQGNRHL